MSLPPSINDITASVGVVSMFDAQSYRVHRFSPDEARLVATELARAADEADDLGLAWAQRRDGQS